MSPNPSRLRFESTRNATQSEPVNYYNEHDPNAAAWLRELIAAGHIPAGDVDERSITEISPDELSDYTQCHFFAGIGGWSLALELAGWPADAPVWTGSCPCQPFSSAGKQLAQADERHLWPAFFSLIRQCRPQRVFGEQVASAIGKGWLDGISADLESEGYACGAAVLGAHSVGAPHLRQRLYWVADATGGQREQRLRTQRDELLGPAHCAAVGSNEWHRVSFAADCDGYDEETGELGDICSICGLDYCEDCQCPGPTQEDEYEYEERDGILYARRLVQPGEQGLEGHAGHGHDGDQPGRINPDPDRHAAATGRAMPEPVGDTAGRRCGVLRDESQPGSSGHAVSTSWSRFEIVHCRDGKARRFEPGSFPLAHGLPGRVGLLRGYGNAIVPQTAAEFIQAFLEVTAPNFTTNDNTTKTA
jgi:DNA (cytosine-5)-methyltransferase 1